MQVPQTYSASIHPGVTADLTLPQFPGRVFTATLTSTSDAVAAQSGAVTAELQTDNADHVLQPGDYAQATFHAPPASAATVLVPASAVMFRHNGMAVGVVDSTWRARIKPVSIRRDLGTSVEIATGLSPSERIINNPPDSLTDGEKVRIATARG